MCSPYNFFFLNLNLSQSKVRTSLEEFTNILMFDDQDRA